MLLLSRFGRFGNVCTTDRDWLVQVVEEQLASLRAELRSAREEVAGERAAAAAALADAERRIGTNQPRPVLIWSLALLDRRCWTGMVGAVACEVVDADCCATESERQLSEERARAAAATARQHAETDTQTAEARATSLEAALAVSRAMIAGI